MKNNKKLTLKIASVILLLAVGLTTLGCVSGIQPIGWSGVAISDSTLFVGSKEGRLVAVRPDGERSWSEPLKAPATGGFGFGCPIGGGSASVAIYGTPVLAGDLVYVAGNNGKVYAYNSNNLQLRWVYPREGFMSPIVGGLAVVLNKIYFGDTDGKVYSLDAPTGDKVWEFQTGDSIWSTPAIDGDTVYVTSFDKKLYALSATDGKKKWEFETEGAMVSSPLVYQGTIYVGSLDRYLYAVTTDGKEKWKFQGGHWFWAKPIPYQDTIYAGSLDRKVYALDAGTGNKIAEFNLESPIASSPVLVGNLVIVATQNGEIYSIDTSTNKHRLLATIKATISAPLSVSDKIVYVHTSDLNVHRINAESGAELTPISLKRPS